jgi:hypothetical protein
MTILGPNLTSLRDTQITGSISYTLVTMSGYFHKSSVLQYIRLKFWIVVFFGPHINGNDIIYNN